MSKPIFKVGEAVRCVVPWDTLWSACIIFGIGQPVTLINEDTYNYYGDVRFEREDCISCNAEENELVLITPLEYVLRTGRNYYSDLEKIMKKEKQWT